MQVSNIIVTFVHDKTNYQRMETVEIVKEFLKERGYKDILDGLPQEKKVWSDGSVLVYQSKDINKNTLRVSVIEKLGTSLLEVEYGDVPYVTRVQKVLRRSDISNLEETLRKVVKTCLSGYYEMILGVVMDKALRP